MQNPIEITGLSKRFVSAGFPWQKKIITPALSDIDLLIEKGSCLAILGPNGAGKTTLLKILSTLILPDEGTARVSGYLVGRDDEKIKSRIGLVSSEERSFYWRLTGRQNLDFFAAMYGLGKKEAQDRIAELCDLFAIDYQGRRFDTYSTGMKKKFGLMKALLHDPEIIFFDEPTKSLDYNTAFELRAFIKELAGKGRTILFATHDMNEAEALCDLFAIFNKGRLCGLGNHEALRRQTGLHTGSLSDIYLKLTKNV